MDTLITAGVYLLQGMFVVGLAGSLLVAVITFVDNIRTLFGALSED
ncbi:MAG: hypothetical protein ACRD24_02185 [Terriglobales bacterium]